VHDGGYAEAGLGDEILLDGVDALCEHLGSLGPDHPRTGDVANPVPKQRIHLARQWPVRAEHGDRHDAGQLHRLFFDGHPAQQLVRALHRGVGTGSRRPGGQDEGSAG
jgi:hypothetical protein